MIIFNGINFADYFDVKVNEIKRPIMAPQQFAIIDIPGGPGSVIGKAKKGSYSIPVKVMVKSETLPLLRRDIRQIAEKLSTEKEAELRFSDEPDVYYLAIVTETDLDEIMSIGKGQINFFISKPSAYGQELYDFFETKKAINNPGTAPAKPIIHVKFTGNTTNFKIELGANSVRVIDNFVNGDELVIDCQKQKILVNNVISMPKLDLKSRFFELEKGPNVILATPGSVTLKFQERYL